MSLVYQAKQYNTQQQSSKLLQALSYVLITLRMRRSRGEMYIVCLSVCLSVLRRIPTLLHGPGCKLVEWQGVSSSCALLGGFAIGARVSLL